MTNIEVKILNPKVIKESEKMMVCAARLTQRGHLIKNLKDFMQLYETSYAQETVHTMVSLPHNTLRQFNMINVVICGASRRFLAQITRRRIGVTFISTSLQYSDYSDRSTFVVPYEILERGETCTNLYLNACEEAMGHYRWMVDTGIDKDAAGYITPQSLGNVLIISATPRAWSEMISQRICRRNTKETRYIMLQIWQKLYTLNPILFGVSSTGASCMRDKCVEGKFNCKNSIKEYKENDFTPLKIIETDFPLFRKGDSK